MAYIPRINRTRLVDNAVGTDQVENGSLLGEDLANGTVDTTQLADFAVTSDKIETHGINNDNLGDQVIDARTIVDETITNLKVATGAGIQFSKLEADPTDRANHHGSQTASTISDFESVVTAHGLDDFAAPAADVSFGGFKATNVGTPENPGDAVNKEYADAIAAGLDPKESVGYTTTGNITLSGLATQGNGTWPGALDADTRILVKDQTDGSENGIYDAKSGAWVRSTDFDGTPEAEVSNGAFTLVAEADGTSLVGTGWIVTTADTIVVDTTTIVWHMFSMPGQASYLDDLLDVDVSTDAPVQGSLLWFDDAANLWKASDNTTLDETTGVLTHGGDTYLNGELIVTARAQLRAIRTDLKVLTANHTIDTEVDHTIVFNTNAASRVATLPEFDPDNSFTLDAGDEVVIKRSGTNPVALTTTDGALIDGSSDDFILDVDLMAVTVKFDGANWWIF